jgi:hypothetical protein
LFDTARRKRLAQERLSIGDTGGCVFKRLAKIVQIDVSLQQCDFARLAVSHHTP